MIETTPTLELLARAIDISAMRQSVYASNIANAGVDGYRRMDVTFDSEIARIRSEVANSQTTGDVALGESRPSVVATDQVVKLDEEIGRMAKNALRYQVLLGAFERSMSTLRTAIREGRE